MRKKRVYKFGNGEAEGQASMKDLLGGKGANLAEMNLIGVPVPPGFTIITDTCEEYYEMGEEKIIELLRTEVEESIKYIEGLMNATFGDATNPLLVSVRSGASASMPGMMDTILDLGLNDEIVEGLAKKTNNPRFAWDSYRRFVQMYGETVLGIKNATKEELNPFEEIIDTVKKSKNIRLDSELETTDLKVLIKKFKTKIKEYTGSDFPDDVHQQLWGAICSVFNSWMNERAVLYRKMEGISSECGTAVNIQAMVYGNMGNTSLSGVCFSRDASTGNNILNGEFLINAQGEDVVAGIRTPHEITKRGSQQWAKSMGIAEEVRVSKYPSMEELMPGVYEELNSYQQKLEDHYKDMQDMEFTVQEGKFWMLQTRNGKRTGQAMVKIAMDLLREGKIDEKTALRRIIPNKLTELLHPVFKPEALSIAKSIAKGLPASPGAACGKIVFFSEDAAKRRQVGEKTILVRIETSAEDLAGMAAVQGILTARGGMTSHAAVVARGIGKCCVSGTRDLEIDYSLKQIRIGDLVLNEGDVISIDGYTGDVYANQIETQEAQETEDFRLLIELAMKYAKMKLRANADTPTDAIRAMNFRATGIGLCRTEHMFFDGERIKAMHEMILAKNTKFRKLALAKMAPYQQEDFKKIFKAMAGNPVTVRLLDPPLHEFIPHDLEGQTEIAQIMGIPLDVVRSRIDLLQEHNPMLGNRGCRLGNTFPEITEMQTRAILKAALELKREGVHCDPEIMIPMVSLLNEFNAQKQIIVETAEKLFEEEGDRIEFKIGTMVETPRAALTAGSIATEAQFMSFGTNDLTQMTFGFSRDDFSSFLPVYLKQNILANDPFRILDQEGVGQLMASAVKKAKEANPNCKCGICGEHGGEPSSIKFCHRIGLDYVSCSPMRIPTAWVSAAQAAIEDS